MISPRPTFCGVNRRPSIQIGRTTNSIEPRRELRPRDLRHAYGPPTRKTRRHPNVCLILLSSLQPTFRFRRSCERVAKRESPATAWLGGYAIKYLKRLKGMLRKNREYLALANFEVGFPNVRSHLKFDFGLFDPTFYCIHAR